jgi:hypothetical protein
MISPAPLIRELVNAHIANYPSVTGPARPITFTSLEEFALALGWIWLLLISFTGWGRLAAKILRIRSLPASVACAAGISIAVFMGGWFNLLHAIHRSVLFAFIAAGLAMYFAFLRNFSEEYRWKTFWKRTPPASRILLLAALLLLAFRIAGSVRLATFDVSDDSAAYLALPQKVLDTNHLAADPFSERRITSSLGGGYFLQDLVLSTTSLSHVGMADRTLGFILDAGIALDLGIVFGLSAFQIALLEFLIFLVPQETFNLTYIVLPVSLLLSLVWLLAVFLRNEKRLSGGFGYAVLAGMVGATTVSLKSTYLPFVGALSIIPFILLLRRKPRFAFQACVAIGAGILLVLISWMVAMKSTSGTYLFPLFGPGLDYSRYGLFHAVPRFQTLRSLAKVFLQAIPLLFLASIQVRSKPRSRLAALTVSVLLASAAAISALNYASSADSIWRYNFPQFFVAVIVFYVGTAAVTATRGSKPARMAFYIGILAMLSMIVYYDIAGSTLRPFDAMISELSDFHPMIASLSGRQLSDPGLREQYRRAESAIPKNEIVLENVAYSFLLNYKSRNIFIMDWPGAAGPSPGWPFGQDSAHVAQYLRSNSIRYVLFDYRYARESEAGICQDLEGSYRFSEWLRQQLWMNVLTINQLHYLRYDYRSIYDDGSMAVIDLNSPSGNASTETTVWGIDTKLDTVCSQVAAHYFSKHPILAGAGNGKS